MRIPVILMVSVFAILLLGALSTTNSAANYTQVESRATFDDLIEQTKMTCDHNAGVYEKPKLETMDRDVMIDEITMVWEMFFEDGGASATDPRRLRFHEFAGYLADAVLMYQRNPTEIGGQLPVHKNVHILLAVKITKESSVTHDVVGPQSEVGLLQIHGVALAGYDPEIVKHNPKLGLMLGVRWLASRVPKCPLRRIKGDDRGWDDYDWLGPLSVYAGGGKAISARTGKCYAFDIAKERVDLTRLYRMRIDAINGNNQ